MTKEFENYLMMIYVAEEHPLDDDIPDGFEDWLGRQDICDIVQHAEDLINKLTEN